MCKMGIVGVPVLVVVNTFMNISCLDFHWANYMCSVQFNDYLIVFLPSAELFLNLCMALKKKTPLCNFTSDYIPSFISCFLFICILFFDQNEAQVILWMCHDLHVLLHALFPLLECIPDFWHAQRRTKDKDPGFLTSRLGLVSYCSILPLSPSSFMLLIWVYYGSLVQIVRSWELEATQRNF